MDPSTSQQSNSVPHREQSNSVPNRTSGPAARGRSRRNHRRGGSRGQNGGRITQGPASRGRGGRVRNGQGIDDVAQSQGMGNRRGGEGHRWRAGGESSGIGNGHGGQAPAQVQGIGNRRGGMNGNGQSSRGESDRIGREAQHGGRGNRQWRRMAREKDRKGIGAPMAAAAATELSQRLTAQVARGEVECVVCLERVRRGGAIWSCARCFVITHLHCARKWGNAGADQVGVLFCPSCRTEQGKVKDLGYKCFCGRRKNPVLEPGVLPGSCGDPCLKQKGEEGSRCPHKCAALCHPGPCAPCVIQVEGEKCLCGKETVFRKCGEAIDVGGLKCGRVCGQVFFGCGHACQSSCHDHDAEKGECDVVVEVKCFCGGIVEKLPCSIGSTGFVCGEICGKLLACGEHNCEMLCHDGKCEECEMGVGVVKTCSCGKDELSEKQKMARKSCLDPLPSCGRVCEKPLGCLKGHSCKNICGHKGICGPCGEDVLVDCRCALNAKEVRCGEDKEVLRNNLVCNRTCNELLLCRRHRCKTVCCMYKKRKPRPYVLSNEVVWSETSAEAAMQGMSNNERRRLGHGCNEMCDQKLGCGLHECDLTCGHTGDCPPCGFLSREPLFCACSSVSIPPPVRCGTDPPSCGKLCSKPRECGHKCLDNCHPGDCTPCMENTRFGCVGGHGESRFLPCHIGQRGIKCSRACGKPLLCGVHACSKPCHSDYPQKCEPSLVDGCSQQCGLPRRTCEHSCASSCHPGMICPDVPCRHMITVSCICGRRNEKAMCLRGGAGGAHESGDSIRLSCDDECTSQARLRAFASAVGRGGSLIGPGASTGLDEASFGEAKYSDFLFQFAEREPGILSYFEQEFAKIVLGKAKKMVLDDLPQLHRLVVHTMAEYYLLDSESTERGKAKRLHVRHRGVGVKPVFPKPLLSEAYVNREKERKRARQLGSGKTLVIHVASSTKFPATAKVEDRVESELRTHAGSYHIKGAEKMSSHLTGVAVEFSTSERALFARNMLLKKPGVTVEIPIIRADVIAQSSASQATNKGNVPRSSAIVSQSWVDEKVFESQGLRNGLPPLPPAAGDSDIADVPDSWDD